MANYTVHFEHYKNDDAKAQVDVPFAIAPEHAADEYEMIVTTAYGLLADPALSIIALGVNADDFVAVKIMHNDELIIDFTTQ